MSSKTTSVSRRDFLRGTLLTVPVLFLSPTSVFAGSLKPVSVRRQSFAMGTFISIEAFGADERLLNHAITKAFDVFHRYDAMMSVYDEQSALSLLNRNAGKSSVRVPTELREVITAAKGFSDETSGAFDITLEPLMKRWGFRDASSTLSRYPTDKEITDLLQAVGGRNIEVGQYAVAITNPMTQIDLGGIAVGYSVDRAVEVLRSEGVEAAFINHSGDAYALGKPPESDGWKCVIPNPLSPNEYLEEFTISDAAVSTSARNEKFVSFEGKQYGHILDPHSGKPSERVLSTTIITEQAIEADALSTSLYTMDVNSGLKLAASRHHRTKAIISTGSEDRIVVHTS
jgi:FAD:protein FMN transferase